MKKIYYYIIFIFFGIVLFILLNNSETLSIGCPYVERGFNIVNGGQSGNYTYTTLNGLVTTSSSYRDFIVYTRVTSVLPIIYLGEFQKEPGGYFRKLLQTRHFFLVAGYLIYAEKILQETEGETIELFKPKNFGTIKPPIKLKVTDDGDNIDSFNITDPERIILKQTYRFTVTGVDGVSINMYNTDIDKVNLCTRIISNYTLNIDRSVCSVSALPVVMSEEYTLPLALNNFISVVPPNAFVVPNNELETNTACDGFFEIYDIDLNRVTRVRGPRTDDDKIGILGYTQPENPEINIGFTNVEELSSGSFGSVYTCSNMPMNLVQSSNNRGDKAYAVATKVYNDPSDSEIDFIRMVYGSNKRGIGWIIKKSYHLDDSDSDSDSVDGGRAGGGLGTITEGDEDSDEPDEPEPEPKPPDTYQSFYNPYYTEGYTGEIIYDKMGLQTITYGTDDNGDYQKTVHFFNNNEFKTTTDNSNIRLSVEIDGDLQDHEFNYYEFPNEVFPVDVSNCNLVNSRVIETDGYIDVPISVMEYMDNNLKTLRDTFLVLVDETNILSNVYILLCLEILKRILLSLVNLLAYNLIYIDLKLQNVLYRCYIDSNIKIVLGDLGSIKNIYNLIYGKGFGQTYQMPEMVLLQNEDDSISKYRTLANESVEQLRIANEYFCSWIICLMFLELFGIDLPQYPILFFQRNFIRAGGGDEVRLLENYYSSEEFMTALTNINLYFDNLINRLIFIRGYPPSPFTEDDIKRIFTLLKVKYIIKGCLKPIPRLLIGEINTLLNLELTQEDLRIMISSSLGQKLTICTMMLNDKIMATTLNDDMKAFLVS